MLTFSFAFAILCFAVLLLFFSGLPNLGTCELPCFDGETEPDHKNRLAVMLITLIYAFVAFWNLGSTDSPQSFVPMEGQSVRLDLPDNADIDRLVLFPGVGQGEYSIEYSRDAEGWRPLTGFTQDHVAVLKWQYIPLSIPDDACYLRIACISGRPWLGELMLQDPSGAPIAAVCSVPELTDEPLCIPEASTFRNSSYFDEIYHARTAWEHLNGIWPYEISHPPLGKEILSLGILLFGMTPFGWRFSGTVTGILMLPVMYLLLRRLYGSGRTPVLGTILLAAGFMHYVQTRIATVDSYAVFFILLMFYYMAGWLKTGRKRDLALSGVMFGLGAACKWTCLYAGAGLAVLWLGHWVLEALEHRGGTFLRFLKNSVFCVLFFVLIPAGIYYLSYYPYGAAENAPLFSAQYTKLVLDNQSFMFGYHANIVAEHPYSSRWYQWILDIRPILYYLEYLPEGKRISFGAFVNPAVCWGGLISLIMLIYLMFFRRDRTAAFLLVAYASGLVPWMFIRRLTFEYHYFASAVFLVPAICYAFFLMEKASARGKRFTIGFTVYTVLLFCWFFPALNGIAVDNELASRLLGWLPSWPL
ncbi:MAG: glycosyltransferase family 39 protein [Oscillospiraceae bacterium]|nr:glycosyltransferase family 39 protein [Oscillospiraceae bacterium]